MTSLLDIRCGFAEPSGHDDIRFNFHLTLAAEKGPAVQWRVVVDLSAVLDLRTNISSYTEEITIDAVFPIINNPQIDEYLTTKGLVVEHLREIDRISRLLETWITAVMHSLPYLDRESQAIIKQLFFKDIQRIALYERLFRALQGEVHYDTTQANHSGHHPMPTAPAVKKTFFSMFSRKKDTSTTLSQRNVSALPGSGIGTTGAGPGTGTKKWFGMTRSQASKSIQGDAPSALDVAQKSILLKVEVTRGHEIKQGVLVYQIALIASGKAIKGPAMHTMYQRYNNFKKLYLALKLINDQLSPNATSSPNASNASSSSQPPSAYANFIHLLTAPFPVAPMKSMFGLSLNDSELSERTRLLDCWLKDIAVHYRNMPAKARLEIRNFLGLDMEQKKDQFFQDQLVWGTVDLHGGAGTAMLSEGSDNESKSLHARELIPDNHSVRSETRKPKGGSLNSTAGKEALKGMVWETASAGGASRIPRKQVKASRGLFAKKETVVEKDNEDDEEDDS